MARPDQPSGEEDGSGAGRMAAVGRYGGYGLSIGASTALFAWLGSIVDERLRTEPLFVLLGTFLGFGAGFYSMYSRLVLSERASRREEGGEGRPDGDGPHVDG